MNAPKQPKDYVEEAGVGENISKTLEHLSNPASVLLFLFLIVLVLVAGDWIITHYQSELLQNWVIGIEENRHQELELCQNTLKDLVNVCLDKKSI